MSHREQFKQSEQAKFWNDIVDSLVFRSACDQGMLHFMSLLGKPTTPEEAAANEYRRQGASAFLDVLKNLNTEQKAPTIYERNNLRTA
ncbi:MAG: hypothetical protein WCI55_08090 [Armatimonadota bacterium]